MTGRGNPKLLRPSSNPAVRVGLSLSTEPSSLDTSSDEPFYIVIKARLVSTPSPDQPVTLWTHLSPLYGLHTRAFENIRCTTDSTKIIEIWPRGWPQYRFDYEDLPAWDKLVTIPAQGQGDNVTKHQVPKEVIAAAGVEPGERYRLKLTDLCLGTKWYTFGTPADLQGKRICGWSSQKEKQSVAEDDEDLDDDIREEMRLERWEKYGDRPGVEGEDPSTLAMVPEVGEIEFEVI